MNSERFLLSFDKIVLPDDNSTFTLHDGTAREPMVFEFDQDGLAEGVIEGPAVIRRFGAGNLDLVGGKFTLTVKSVNILWK